MGARRAAIAWTVVLCGCGGGDDAALTVDLLTDLAPVDEFTSVRTEIGSASSSDHTAFLGEPYVSGVRVADVSGLAPGPTTVRVTLLDASAMPVASRELRLELEGRRVITVVITRNCVDVECPGAGDDPSFTTCRAGRCVDPGCGEPGTPGCGGADCDADADCTASCGGPGVCATGECLCPPPCVPMEESCNERDDDCDSRVDETFDLASDVRNCGTCGQTCTAAGGSPVCSGGACSVSCSPGRADCNGSVLDGCETLLGTPEDCGGCGEACGGATPLCSSSSGIASCVSSCSAGTMLCGASCVDLDSDPAHCGLCTRACDLAHATPVCSGGTCEISTCEVGWADCNGGAGDGCERPTTTPTDCGGCDSPCAPLHATASCATGTCRILDCDEGWGNCDTTTGNGCETSTETVGDCGACGRTCTLAHASEECVAGACRIASCDPGWTDEDGADSTGCEQSCTGICGDANQDGDVSVIDALKIQRFWMGLEEPTMCARMDGDVLRDGTFGQADANVVQGMVLGYVTSACIPCTYACGDANGTGGITSSDALLVQMRYMRMPATYDACEFWRFDATGDAGVDMEDSDRILQASVGSAMVSCAARN